MKAKLLIDGMSCNHCANRVNKTLLAIEGIIDVKVVLKDDGAYIEFEGELKEEELKTKIYEAGYELVEIKYEN